MQFSNISLFQVKVRRFSIFTGFVSRDYSQVLEIPCDCFPGLDPECVLHTSMVISQFLVQICTDVKTISHGLVQGTFFNKGRRKPC